MTTPAARPIRVHLSREDAQFIARSLAGLYGEHGCRILARPDLDRYLDLVMRLNAAILRSDRARTRRRR